MIKRNKVFSGNLRNLREINLYFPQITQMGADYH